jgi:hypothetical protein
MYFRRIAHALPAAIDSNNNHHNHLHHYFRVFLQVVRRAQAKILGQGVLAISLSPRHRTALLYLRMY